MAAGTGAQDSAKPTIVLGENHHFVIAVTAVQCGGL